MNPFERLLKWWRQRNYMRSRWEDQAEHWQGDDMPPLQLNHKAGRERALLGNAFWLVLMVLMLLIGFALGASFIAALRDGIEHNAMPQVPHG